MKKANVSEYFGGTEPWTVPPNITMDLEFDDKGVDNISQLVFDGMRRNDKSKTTISRDDMRTWTKKMLELKHPGVPFNEENFEKGFVQMDVDKNGKLTIKDIRLIVLAKVKKANLYSGK